MKDHMDTIKVLLVSGSGWVLTITQFLGDIISLIGATAATAYTIYKLVILHKKTQKEKQNLINKDAS